MPASPFLMPNRQPTLPALQSVSQPAVLTIASRSWKSVVAVERRQDDQGVVGNHVAVAREPVVAIRSAISVRVLSPIVAVVAGVPFADVIDHAPDQAVPGYDPRPSCRAACGYRLR